MGTLVSLKQKQLVSVRQMEQWKDKIGAWWGKERQRYNAKQTIKIFRRVFKLPLKVAIQWEINSREDEDTLIEDFLKWLMAELHKRLAKNLRNGLKIVGAKLALDSHDGAIADVQFKGEEYRFDVPGIICIIGEVYYAGGIIQTLWPRFIGHPFWQWSHSTREK